VHAHLCSRQQRVRAHADWRHHCIHLHACCRVGYCNRERYSPDLDVLWLDGGQLHRTVASAHHYVVCLCTGGTFKLCFNHQSVLTLILNTLLCVVKFASAVYWVLVPARASFNMPTHLSLIHVLFMQSTLY